MSSIATHIVDLTGGTVHTVDTLLAAAVPSGSAMVTAINSALGGTTWQSGGSGTPTFGSLTGAVADNAALVAAFAGKAASSHTHTLSQITDVTVTSDMVAITKGFRPGLYDDLVSPPVGTIIESSNDGHLYWIHRDGSRHLLCDSGGYGGGGTDWGDITGTLSFQADLQAALDGKQPLDVELTALAGLTSASNKLPYFSGSGTAALADFTAFGRSLVASIDASAALSTIGGLAATDSLTQLGALTPTDFTFPYFTSTGAALATLTAAGRALLDDTSAASMRSTLGLVIGSNVQAYDAELQAIAGLTSASDKGIQFTGSGTAATFDLTAAAKTLLDDASTDVMITTLGGVAYTGTGGLVRRNNPVITGSLSLENAILTFDRYASVGNVKVRRANGSVASPTGVLSGEDIAVFSALGYHSGGDFHGVTAGYILFRASENYTSTAQGTHCRIFTTPLGTIVPVARIYIGESGNVGIGLTSEPTTKFDINGDMFRLRTAKTPATASSTGNQGEICWDASYLYICTATNTWRRILHATW